MAHLLKMFNKPAPLLIYINITGLQVDLEKLGDPQGRFGLEEGNPLIFQEKDIKSTGLQGSYGLEGTNPLKNLHRTTPIYIKNKAPNSPDKDGEVCTPREATAWKWRTS